MKNKQKKVYVALAVDLIHRGHLNILNIAKKYGKVTVGLLTDRAISSYKKPPILDFKERLNIAKNLKAVDNVIPQESLDYTKNLKLLKPDFVVHGDDWKKGIQKNIRKKVIDTLKMWNGKLIEPKYTAGISSSKINDIINSLGTTPDIRRKSLKRYLEMKGFVRFLDIHNGLSGLIIEKTKVKINGKFEEFDGMWGSSLTNSTAKGKPDIEAVDLTERLQLLNEVLEVTTKPIIFDGDTGGKTEHFVFTVKTLERLGVSAVIIEDKKGLKKNSLFGTEVYQQMDSINSFARKIKAGKKAKSTSEFMIIARIESLIMNKGIGDNKSKSLYWCWSRWYNDSRRRDPLKFLNFAKYILNLGVENL